MAEGHKPVPLIVRVDCHVGVTGRERAFRIRVPELRRPVAFGVVGVAVGAVEGEAVAASRLRAAARAVAGLVVDVVLARPARRQQLIGGVEREGARALATRSAKRRDRITAPVPIYPELEHRLAL